jgi:four helix bundle protein
MRDSYDALNGRTKKFAVDVVTFARELDELPVVRWLTRQLVSAATSVAANQRAARRSRSSKELLAKLSIVVEEADESAFWCEFLQELSIPKHLIPTLIELTDEAQQLLAIFSKGRATMRRRAQLTSAVGMVIAVLLAALSF